MQSYENVLMRLIHTILRKKAQSHITLKYLENTFSLNEI